MASFGFRHWLTPGTSSGRVVQNEPQSSGILQKLAESSTGLGIQHGDRHGEMHAPRTTDEAENGTQNNRREMRDSYEAIEADLKAASAEVKRLKAQAQAPVEKSPAVRLMRLHDEEARMPPPKAVEPVSPLPPTPADFPSLMGMKPSSPATMSKPSKSYAAAAGSTRTKRADSKIPTPAYTPRQSLEHSADPDSSVIITPQPADPAATSKDISQSPTRSSTKNGFSRFAQPTQSFARRAGETLRGDSLNTSLTKSVRSGVTDIEADKHVAQRANKRTSLPFDWTGRPGLQQQRYASPSKTLDSSSPTVLSSPISNEDCQIVHSDTTIQQSSPPQQLRKKTSSYMQPTASANQRVISTLSEEGSRKSSVGPLKKSKTGLLKLDTAVAGYYQFGSQKTPDTAIVLSSPDNSLPLSATFPAAPWAAQHLTADVGMGLLPSTPPKRPRGKRKIHATVQTTKAVSANTGVPTYGSRSPLLRKSQIETAPRARANTSRQAAMLSVAMLAGVAHTTTRRRTSHADILKSILTRIEEQGLLRSQPNPQYVSETAQQSTPGRAHGAQLASAENGAHHHGGVGWAAGGKNKNVSSELQDIALLAKQGNAGKGTIIPPHVRKRSGAVSLPNDDMESPILSHRSVPARETDAGNHDVAILEAPAAPKTSSLNVMAADFEPMWKPTTIHEEFSLLEWTGALRAYSPKQWSEMSPEIKHAIRTLRAYKQVGLQMASANTLPRGGSTGPSRRAQQRFWGELMKCSNQTPHPMEFGMSPMSSTAGASSMTEQSVSMSSPGPTTAAVQTTSPNSVQTGQVLKPALSPGKKTVQWVLEDTDGKVTPVSFDHAPPPPITTELQPAEDLSLIVSPTSDKTTQTKTPDRATALSSHAWTIGAGGYHTQPYGWTGGDGREISFSGYGLNAEINPNSPVNMQFYANQDAPTFAAGGHPGSFTKTSPNPKVFPRSRKQWAEYLGYDKVPSNKMEFVKLRSRSSGVESQRREDSCCDCDDVTTCYDCDDAVMGAKYKNAAAAMRAYGLQSNC